METRDTFEGRGAAVTVDQDKPVSIDRFVATRRFEEREEEEKVEAAMALYEKAARARMTSEPPPPPTDLEELEELEAQSQWLKLQQKCQDIAALIMVDELEEEEE